jgi:D-alanyl-D-alanine carboxypeptidase
MATSLKKNGWMWRLWVAVAVGCVWTSGPAAASDRSTLQEAMDRIVSGGFPGAWATDSKCGSAAAGLANLLRNQPVEPDMKLRIASITKSFVGAVALQLVAERRLGLDDSLGQWVPGILPYANFVTVRQLLQHTSGVPDYLAAPPDSVIYQIARGEISRNRTFTPAELVALIADQPRHALPPNEAEYSDTNYILVGMVIEAVTNRSVQDEVRRRFIIPLHLTHTSFPETYPYLTPPFARGYSYPVDAEGSPILTGGLIDFTNYNPSFLGAAGAMISNPEDLNRFMKALVGGSLLPPHLTHLMKQSVPITLPEGLFPPGFGAGLGVWTWDLQNQVPGCNQRIIGHEGETLGYNSWSFADVNGRRAISMGVNLMFPDWEAYYATEMAAYASLWCRSGH